MNDQPTTALGKIAGSSKFVFALFVICVAGGLVFVGRVTSEQFVDLTKWIGGSAIVARGLEGLGVALGPPADTATTTKSTEPKS